MTRLLLYIKHRLPFVWRWIEWLNGLLFYWLECKSMIGHARQSTAEYTLDGFGFRLVEKSDLTLLHDLLQRQRSGRLDYFRPHEFDLRSLTKALDNPAFVMFGVFADRQMVGYFFLRCFWNRRCFVGRLIDEPYEKRGIGRVMNQIMYQTAWRSGFRIFTTVSTENTLVMRSHANNPTARVRKRLANNFLLVEFVPDEKIAHEDAATSVKAYLAKSDDIESNASPGAGKKA